LGRTFGNNYIKRKNLKLKKERKMEKTRRKAETHEHVWPFFSMMANLTQSVNPSEDAINEMNKLYTPGLIANIDESGINLSWDKEGKVVTIDKDDSGEIVVPNQIGNITFFFTVFCERYIHSPRNFMAVEDLIS
jgi:hypothetical protein